MMLVERAIIMPSRYCWEWNALTKVVAIKYYLIKKSPILVLVVNISMKV